MLHTKNFQKKNEKTDELNFWSLSKIFWKEQIIYTFLVVLSVSLSKFVDNNTIKRILDASTKEKNWVINWEIFFLKVGKTSFKKEQTGVFSLIMGLIILFYVLIVFSHIFYAFYLANKVLLFIKKRLFEKLSKLEKPQLKHKIISVFTNHCKNFSNYVFFIPNQILYCVLDILATFYQLFIAEAKKVEITKLFLSALLFTTGMIASLVAVQVVAYFKEKKLQNKLNSQSEKENFLINKIELITKKSLTEEYRKEYYEDVEETKAISNKKDTIRSLYAFPSYSFDKFAGIILIAFAGDKNDSAYTIISIVNLLGSIKKIADRTKEYFIFKEAKEQTNSFLMLKERDDIQKNLLFSEKINEIIIRDLAFTYSENPENKNSKWIFKNFNQRFTFGQINFFSESNGFGKSTLINLIMGLNKAQQGEIIINNKHYLSELNLVEWRKKISFSEHNNLVTENLSTGEKQLKEISNVLQNWEKKEIFIFDEADNALDTKNKEDFIKKIEEISKTKIVIYISH